jgi:acyl-CoA thioester hydrolase
MPRLKIQLPDQFTFSTLIPVRITDLNYGNHVGNDSMLSILHEARMQFLAQFGYTELEIEGVGIIMSDVSIEFKTEVFYGDVIRAYVAVMDFTRAGFDLYYKLTRTSDETVIVFAKTGMICYDYTKKKVVKIPEEASRKLKETSKL